ncbi:MAG: transketolase [Planctomycetota bacterium]
MDAVAEPPYRLTDPEALRAKADRLRARVIALSHTAGTPHLASALSCLDLLTTAYYSAMRFDPARTDDPARDRLIFSKGHAIPALYAVLHDIGVISDALLADYNRDGAVLAEQPAPFCAPGVEVATGSLGHGLPIGIGMALSGRIRGDDRRVFVLMSDGECNEGSVWEAAMFAPAQKLDRLCVLIDFNKWQATGRSREVMAIDPFVEKWRAFGWSAHEVDGHDPAAISAILENFPDGSGRPIAIVGHTVKGKGVSFMEDDNNWHYKVPDRDAFLRAWSELGQPEEEALALLEAAQPAGAH